MKKTLTISALVAVLSLPAFAEIANNATCNNTNLGQSDNNSTANVEANWNANTININWYNGDTRILQNTCTYDGTITLPAQPSKPGYTFAGWRLRTTIIAPDCSVIDNKSECNAASNCVYFVWGGEDDENGTCETFSGGTKCSAITNESGCSGNYGTYNSAGHCYWEDNRCNFAVMSG